MFASVPPEDRLDPTDAQFVDVLHTDMNCKYNTFVANDTKVSKVFILSIICSEWKTNTMLQCLQKVVFYFVVT